MMIVMDSFSNLLQKQLQQTGERFPDVVSPRDLTTANTELCDNTG